MITYNPTVWFSLIFHAYSRKVFRKLFPVLIFMACFTWAFCYYVLGYLGIDHGAFIGTTAVHQLLGIVLGLFLVFRTNTAYDRWWEGRRQWGALVNSTRNFSFKLSAYVGKDERELRVWFAHMIANFAFATKEHLRTGVKLSELEPCDGLILADLEKYSHKPNRISALLYEKVNALTVSNTISGYQFLNLDKELKDFTDIIGACERIKKTPIPYSYSMYIKKFIFIYIITLPFGFVTTFDYFTIGVVLFVTYVLLSVELIAEEIEDPFGYESNDLPTDELAVTIKNNVHEILLGV